MLQRIHFQKLQERRKGRTNKPLPTFKPFVVVPTDAPTVYRAPSSVGSLSSFTSRQNDFPESSPTPPPPLKSPEAAKENNPLTIPIHKPTSNVQGRGSGRGSFRVRPSKDFQLPESSTTHFRTSLSSAVTTTTTTQKRLREEYNEQHTLKITRREQVSTMEVDTLSLGQQSSSLHTRAESIHSMNISSVRDTNSSRRSVDAQELHRLVSPMASPTIRSASVISDRSAHSQQRRSPSVAQSSSRRSESQDRRSPSIANSQVRASPSIIRGSASPVANDQVLRSSSIVAEEQTRRSPSIAMQTRRSVSAALESTRSASPVVIVERETSLAVIDESKKRSPSVSHLPGRKSPSIVNSPSIKSLSPKRSPSVTSAASRHSPAVVDSPRVPSPSASIRSSVASSTATTTRRSPSQRAPTVSLEEQQALEHSITEINIINTNVENDVTFTQGNQVKRPETSDEALKRAFDVDMGDDIDYTNYADPEDMGENGSNREASIPIDVDIDVNIDSRADNEHNDRETDPLNITDEEISSRAKEIAFNFQKTNVLRLQASKLGNLHVDALHQLTSEAVRSVRNIATDPFVRSVVEDFLEKLSNKYKKCHTDYNEYLKITTALEKLGKLARSTRNQDKAVERERMQIERKERESSKEIADLDRKIEKLEDLDDFWDTVKDLVKPSSN